MAGYSTTFKLTAALIALALLVGGAGLSFPMLQLLLGIAAVLVAAYMLINPISGARGPLDRWALLLVGLVLALPLLQLIPLPPAVWQTLPGRDMLKETDQLLGWSAWRPLTLDVEATIRTWLVLIPSAVVFVGCLRLETHERARLLWLVVGFALLNALLGIIQMATIGGATPYPSTHSGDPIGFFVNRNHSAAIMLAAMPIAAGLGSAQSGRAQNRTTILIATTTVIAVLAIMVIGTTSRTGLLLLPVGLVVSLFILFRRKSSLRQALPALLAIAVLGLVLVTSSAFDRVLDRFVGTDDPRFLYWADIQYALQHYGVMGTGVGTFIPVFQSAESLEGVVPQIVNHAHNDYLEILLGGGIAGALLFGAFLILVAVAIHRGSASRQPETVALRFAVAAAIALILAYSLVDYPLRMPAIASVFAVCCAFLLPGRRQAPGESEQGQSVGSRREAGSKGQLRLKRAAGLASLSIILVVMVQASMSARAIAQHRYDAASRWASWSTVAKENLATNGLTRNNYGEAWRQARAALRLSPISVPAIRTLGLVLMVEGKPQGDRLMQMAVALGWRDPVTQLWAVEAAQRSGEPVKATQRAEALFRQRIYVAPALQLLLGGPQFDAVSLLLASKLAERPYWRTDLLHSAGKLPASQLSRFQTVLSRLNGSGAPATTDEMKPVLDQLLADGRTAEAQRLWRQINPDLIDNGDFSAFRDSGDGLTLPAGWQVPPQNRMLTTVSVYDAKAGSRGLRVGGSNWLSILSQDTMLPPGSYSLSFQARESGPVPVILRWQMRCAGSTQTQVAEARLEARQNWRFYSATFDVPPRDCPVQRLALRRVNANNESETWLDRISFRPVYR